MRDHPQHFNAIKALGRFAGVFTLGAVLASSLHSVAAQPQQGSVGPSFSCEKAKTGTEKLICSDKELSALDLEYSRLYERELKESTGTAADALKSNAKFFLQSRDRCAIDKVGAEPLRPSSVDCVANWYYWRIAELSELPMPPPAEWTPRLIGGARIFTNRNRGLPQTQAQKPVPMIYFKPRDVDKFFKWIGNSGEPQPASINWSGVYYVYQNVLGSLTLVMKYSNEGHLDESYFFNKDGGLAAQQRRFDAKAGSKIYVENETVYYGAQEQETHRFQQAYYDGKLTTVRKELSPPRLEKPSFRSLAGLNDAVFKNAEVVDAEKLGICIIGLSDGYGAQTRILNLPAQPLDVYRLFPPPMNYRNFDSIYAVRGKASGVPELLGTLGGKRVYAVRYPSGMTGVLVERQANRFLPVLYVKPEQKIDRLEVMKVGNEDLLVYSSTISGTGHFTLDWYFTLENGVPKSIHYRAVLAEELKKILPEKSGVWKGGGFNPDTLVFSHSVWEEGNANCCPSGGSVEVVLGLEKGRFVVKSSHYEKPK